MEVEERESEPSVLQTEPSFPRWCRENGAGPKSPSSRGRIKQEEAESGGVDQPDVWRERLGSFEQKSMHSSPSFAVHVNRNGGERKRSSAPFDVENGDAFAPAPTGSVSVPMVLKTLFFVIAWYAFSTCLTIYNKILLGDKLGKFPAPLLMNTVHFAMQAVLSNSALRFGTWRVENSESMTRKDYLLRVVPTALATAFDINLSNASLVSITVTFATMCKSASPIFLLLFAFAFRLERPSIRLFGIIFIISIGVLLTVEKETEFEFWGFIFVMLAAVMSGFRWSMTQILLQKEAYGLKDPISLMCYVAPVMTATTLILSLVMEPWSKFYKNAYFDGKWDIIRTCFILLIGGVVAFLMVFTEYALVSRTSAVTLTIAGVVKEAVTILVAVIYFHDQFTLIKGVGLVIILVGVSLYNFYKYQKLLKGELSNGEESTSVSNAAVKYVILDDMDSEEVVN